MEKPKKIDIHDVAEDLQSYLNLLPKAFKLPAAEQDDFFQGFRHCLGLLHDLIIGVYPHLLINQGDQIEIVSDDDDEDE